MRRSRLGSYAQSQAAIGTPDEKTCFGGLFRFLAASCAVAQTRHPCRRRLTALRSTQQHLEHGGMSAFRSAVCITVASTMTLAGCTTPKPLEAIPVPATNYTDLDCDQLNAEAQRVLNRYTELGGELDETEKEEAALKVLGGITQGLWPLIILWLPFIPVLQERKEEKHKRVEEFRHLMGERDAVLKAAAEKGCRGIAQQQAGRAGRESSPPKADGEPPAIPDTSK